MTAKNAAFLIVDDEPDMCWALIHILEKKGFMTRKAHSGSEALRLMARYRFQMAFLDAKLPDVEGLEMAGQIRALDPEIQIVIISGYFYDDDIEIQRALDEGLISGFISKPFSHEAVYRAIPDSFVNEL